MFLSVDPMADKYPRWNPYHYVHNNPVRLVDPDGMEADDIIIRGSNGKTFYWTLGAKYKGDKFIEHTVTALNALSDDPKTANFSFKGRKSTGIDFKGNAVLDYAAGGSKDEKNVFIEHADNNPMDPGENQHIKGTVYWDPSRGVVEEGLN